MRRVLLLAGLAVGSASASQKSGLLRQDQFANSMLQTTDSLYDLHATDIHGSDVDLGVFNNTVTLVVNVATY